MNLSDFPPDVIEAAEAALLAANTKARMLGEATDPIECIAGAIMADRAGRVNVAGLTARQADCLRFIAAHQRENNGITPSFDQIKDGLGLASKSGVTRLLDELEDRGRLTRMPGLARAITIITAPGA
jgi:DNA-binding MarR family transcriptional regulator